MGASKFNLFCIVGATASGKTALGVQLARVVHGEIISADSRQVYRGLDIGSGKDLHEYGEVPYHLIDVVDPGYEYNLFDYQQGFNRVFEDIRSRNKLPLLVGGSGLYLDAVLSGYQLLEVPIDQKLHTELATLSDADLSRRLQQLEPDLHNRTDLKDRERTIRAIEIALAQQDAHVHQGPEIAALILGLRWDRPVLRQRITERLRGRLAQGMIEEVAALHEAGVSWETLAFYGLEYRFVAQYLQGKINHNDLFQKLNSAIHKFAKRQDTWFRKMERKGLTIHWIDAQENTLEQSLKIIESAGG